MANARLLQSNKTECNIKSGNGKCESSCNNLNCSYDSGDCLTNNNTWSKCTDAARCQTSFYNDTCDTVCNKELCLYDHLKCKTIVYMKLSEKYNETVPEVESLGDPGLRMLYQVQNTPDCNTDSQTVCWNTCQHGFYGDDYNLPCDINCKSGCNLFDGSCIGGCLSNFSGDMCQSLCSSNCRLGCSSGNLCISGECNAGYTGAECTTECSGGTHGYNCDRTCSLGCLDGNCNVLDGSCYCRSGYNGTQCEIECTDGTYGLNCNGTCGNCLYGVSYDKMNGPCLNGCSAGRRGKKDNYQSHLDTQFIIGEGKKTQHSDTESQQSTSDACGVNEVIHESDDEQITVIGL
ncbi:Hypothetical predicted protein [Mytilus galloprovincialis]|uniref:EGF-like domain-containing protein n=1 Tax=Mytilus galloprovincialis TaxID=29158 RepID=A0A8B6G8Q2_MYTGA|nr:Hypothetical predicted protein [Mytilus galloprovincialis]